MLWLQLPLVLRLLPEMRYILAAFAAWPLLWQLIPLLNHRGRYTAARLLFRLSSLGLVAFLGVQVGPATENHLFVIVVFVAGFVIYPPREAHWPALVVGLSAATMVGLKWHHRVRGGMIDFAPRALEVAEWSSMAALFLMILAMAVHRYRIVTAAERMLELEHRRSEGLLLNILPAPIADRIEDASVLFADLIGFTPMASRFPPERVVEILDALFSEFDRIGGRHGLERIKTIGDSTWWSAGCRGRPRAITRL